MITKKFGIDFYSSGGALTLSPGDVSNGEGVGEDSKTHENGWTISGDIYEDYYSWVNKFEAVHPELGRVWGDFEDEVYAESEAGYQDFYENFSPEAWDYQDI